MSSEKTSHGIHLGFTLSTRAEVQALGQMISCVCVSHPKAGRTWLRFMLGEYMSLEPDPRLHMAFVHDGADGEGRVDDELDPVIARRWYTAYPLVVLARDPRDIVVSNYFQVTRRDRLFGHQRPPELQPGYPISNFIRRPDFGVDSVIDFYNLWLRLITEEFPEGTTLLVSYEQMTAAPERVLTGVLGFFGLRINSNRVVTAVRATTFDELKRRERERPTRCEILRPADPRDPASFKVRCGRAGGYRNALAAADIDFLDRRIQRRLAPGIFRTWYHRQD